jgi:hypothetical protein
MSCFTTPSCIIRYYLLLLPELPLQQYWISFVSLRAILMWWTDLTNFDDLLYKARLSLS